MSLTQWKLAWFAGLFYVILNVSRKWALCLVWCASHRTSSNFLSLYSVGKSWKFPRKASFQSPFLCASSGVSFTCAHIASVFQNRTAQCNLICRRSIGKFHHLYIFENPLSFLIRHTYLNLNIRVLKFKVTKFPSTNTTHPFNCDSEIIYLFLDVCVS